MLFLSVVFAHDDKVDIICHKKGRKVNMKFLFYWTKAVSNRLFVYKKVNSILDDLLLNR